MDVAGDEFVISPVVVRENGIGRCAGWLPNGRKGKRGRPADRWLDPIRAAAASRSRCGAVPEALSSPDTRLQMRGELDGVPCKPDETGRTTPLSWGSAGPVAVVTTR